MHKSIGVLALQGAFIEHEKMLEKLGADVVEIRSLSDLETLEKNGLAGIVLPGGESTVQGKLLRDLGMINKLRGLILEGLPVLATCAGMILLATEIVDDDTSYISTMPIRVRRNAYGRQLGSFITTENVKGIGDIRMNFIRAPYVDKVLDPKVEILAKANDRIVAVRYNNMTALSFHPEVTDDARIHKYFLDICEGY